MSFTARLLAALLSVPFCLLAGAAWAGLIHGPASPGGWPRWLWLVVLLGSVGAACLVWP